MNVLVVGSGGREHALCWAIATSPLCDSLFCMPGNAGIARLARCVDGDPLDFDAMCAFCRTEAIGFVVVGPEAPLAAGLVDRLEAAGIPCFGPSAAAARLESSKSFTRALCQSHGIPGPKFSRFTDAEAAKAYVRAEGTPIVVKADGLAAGKGVIVAETEAEAVSAIDRIAGGDFGDKALVIEECLVGEEASFFALVDGSSALALAGAQDHKRIGDGDTGPNTGGMGAYSPAPVITPALESEIMTTIVRPTVAAMSARGTPFKGVLYAGLMITDAGPKLLEYNVRFGDPECQVLMMRLASDLLPVLIAAREGRLAEAELRWFPEAALCVVMAAKGYPGTYRKGSLIKAVDRFDDDETVVVFHAGTRRKDDHFVADGGRVLGVTARGLDIAEARANAYDAVRMIQWADGYWRTDIGSRATLRTAAGGR